MFAARDIRSLGFSARALTPELVKRIPGAPRRTRIDMFEALKAVHGESFRVLPWLTRWLETEDEEMRTDSAATLATYHEEAAKTIPKIIELIDREKIKFEDGAAALGEFGPSGKSAIPFLESRFQAPLIDGMAVAAAFRISPDDKRVRSSVFEKLTHGPEETKCRVAAAVLSAEKPDPKFLTLIARADLSKNRSLACFDMGWLLNKNGLLKKESEEHDPRTKNKDVHLALTVPRPTFMIGETIPVTLHLTYSGSKSFDVTNKTYDRSGRIGHLGFDMRDSRGVRVTDPVCQWGMIAGGGLEGRSTVSSKQPYTQTADINEWFRPNKPGRYEIISTPWLGPFVIKSPPISIKLVPASERFVVQTLARAKAGMASGDLHDHESAARLLRFLLDKRAIPPMIRALEDSSGNVAFESLYGLRAFPEPQEVAKQLKESIRRSYPTNKDVIRSYADLLARAESGVSVENCAAVDAEAYDRSEAKWRVFLESGAPFK